MADAQAVLIPDQRVPPQFCQYASGSCDQDYSTAHLCDALFLYPTKPEALAATIEDAISRLGLIHGEGKWLSWKNLNVSGQVIFCEICKSIRFCKHVVADVSTLNFNLLFEIGYALGVGIPVLPIRDTSHTRDAKEFEELGILDTFGYFDYRNSNELSDAVIARQGVPALAVQAPPTNSEQPLYFVKSPYESDATIRLMSVIKKSRLRFRTFDIREVARISLHEAYKQTVSSRAVILQLLDPDVRGAEVHNARCAFIAGIAMASQKRLLMLQPRYVTQPIDFRDLVVTYQTATQIPDLVIPMLGQVIEEIQTTRFVPTALKLTPLEQIDLGDLAAENEIKSLDAYFVPTAQYQQAKRGHARLVVGRKGSGKTALFYGLRSTFRPIKSHLVLDLKPEGHQFTKLREAVLTHLSSGVKQHVLTAFWNYLLVMELAHQVLHYESNIAYRDLRLKRAFERISELYGEQLDSEQADFSERLLHLVNRLVASKSDILSAQSTFQITTLVYEKPLKELNDAVAEYLSISKRDVWLLFDNLDKGWPIQAIRSEDILLLRSLLEATRKLQRQFENRDIDLFSVVFVRNDIYQHLILEPAERGKETAAILDWNDADLFRDLISRRINQSINRSLSFDELWGTFFPPHIRGEDSFQFILSRTLMRPREVLRFVRECINSAINHRRDKVTEKDVLDAERIYSADALVDISLEMKDVRPEYDNVPYAFIGSNQVLAKTEVDSKLGEAGVPLNEIEEVVQLLLWFGVLGIYVNDDEERYSYQFEHDPRRMLAGLSAYAYCIHPAFRVALGCGA